MMDFFEHTTQKRIVQIVMNVSRHSSTEQDFDDFIMPIMPCLCMLLQMRHESGQERVENVSIVITRICESFMRFYSPHSQFDKITVQFEKLAKTGIIEGIMQALYEFSALEEFQRTSLQGASPEKASGNQKTLSQTTIKNFLKALSLNCKFSAAITESILDINIFKIIEGLLPSQEDHSKQHFSTDQFPYTLEAISLLDTLIPDIEDEQKSQQEIPRARVEKQKRQLYANKEQQHVAFVAEKLLPKVFYVYDNNIAQMIRVKALQIIDKMISLFNDELLKNFIEPHSFAKFIQSNFRSNNTTSIKICLQMVEKLTTSNPLTYTLPLIREGVAQFICKISNAESFEKTLGVKAESKEIDKDVSSLEEAEAIIEAKTALINQTSATNQDQKLQFEQTLQRYLEAAKLTSQTTTGPVKTQNEVNKKIIAQADSLRALFFENENFLTKVSEQNGDDFQIISKLRHLADLMNEESTKMFFEMKSTKRILGQLVEYLTSNKQIVAHELKESGLLEALNVYLTYTPKQAKLYLEKKRAAQKGEEMKHSEEMQMNSITKDSKRTTKKEGRCFLHRLKVFTHYILSTSNGKVPLVELVHLCHGLLSQSESQIFDSQLQQEAQHIPPNSSMFGFQHQTADLNSSVSALRQLTRRTRVDLKYDPTKSFLKGESEKKKGKATDLLQESDPQMSKTRSHHPAFKQLGAFSEKPENHSKVFVKRNYLYSELKQVLISVEQCASLYLLEDFLRNKIKTTEDVKSLKVPPSFCGQIQRATGSKSQRQIIEQALEKMRELMELSKTRRRSDSDQYAQALADEILNSKDLSEQEQSDLIKHLEIQSLAMMDDMYAGEDSMEDEMRQEAFEERLMNGVNEEDTELDEKINDFHQTLESLKAAYKEKKALKQQLKHDYDAEMKNEEEMKREEGKADDVEMTDEDEEAKKHVESVAKKFHLSKPKEITLSIEGQSQQHKEIINQDLEELIKANGEDIEYEFYFNGQLLSQNQTLFEILKLRDQKQKKSRAQYYSHVLSRGDQATIYYTIKDKKDDLSKHRQDSILEFAQKKERTKSEAVDDISISSVNCVVQQMIEKDFQVLSKQNSSTEKEGSDSSEAQQLEHSLKILKVLNFVCKNVHLLSNKGIKFLLSSTIDGESMEEGFNDEELLIAISQLHPSLFHHHKLDAYILKNIQDPYNLIGGVISDKLQQIFRNCPFLFPFQTRQLFFKLISFIGAIDMNRSIYFLKQFLKSRGGNLNEDKNAIKISKQKAIVERGRVLDSALSLMKQINKRAFLVIEYKDEQGTGLGPTLEFYTIVAEEIKTKRPDYWRKDMADNTLFPSPVQLQNISNDELQKVYELFRLTGTMIAKSIVDDRLIDLPISPIFWDLLLGRKMTIFDLERIDTNLFRIFSEMQLLANRKREIEKKGSLDADAKLRQINSLKTSSGAHAEDLGLTFVLPGCDSVELRKNGREIDVDIHNLQEFIDLVLHYTFHETIKMQISAFKKGFNSIFPIESLKPFSSAIELEDMICGTTKNDEEWKNPSLLMENIVPSLGYHSKSSEYLNFIKFLTELDQAERRMFLKFVTGSPRLPHGGFQSLDPKLTLVLKKPISPAESPDDILPSVMTCQHYVKLPSYSSYELMQTKFKLAYTEGSNNFTLS